MSKRTKRQSLLSTLDEVFGPPPDLPITSPKEAAMFLEATDDHQDHPERSLPRCKELGKVCYPSRKVATATARRVQKKRNTFLRVYFCDHCKHHHLTSQNPS
jgi:hypothetical protein